MDDLSVNTSCNPPAQWGEFQGDSEDSYLSQIVLYRALRWPSSKFPGFGHEECMNVQREVYHSPEDLTISTTRNLCGDSDKTLISLLHAFNILHQIIVGLQSMNQILAALCQLAIWKHPQVSKNISGNTISSQQLDYGQNYKKRITECIWCIKIKEERV